MENKEKTNDKTNEEIKEKRKGGRPKGSTNKKKEEDKVTETTKTIFEQINTNEKSIAEFSSLEFFNELKYVHEESSALKQVAKKGIESRSGIYSTIEVLFKLLESGGEEIKNIRDFFDKLYPLQIEKLDSEEEKNNNEEENPDKVEEKTDKKEDDKKEPTN